MSNEVIPEVVIDLAEKRRKKDRERKQKERAKEKQRAQQTHIAHRDQWHNQNRANLSPSELESALVLDAQARDFVLVMNYMDENCLTDDPSELGITLDDLNYIFDKDVVAELVAFVKQNECPHTGYVYHSEEIPFDWCHRNYWQEPQLLERLCAEGHSTEIFIRTGLLTSPPDWIVARFLQTHAGWTWQQVAALLGYKIDSANIVRYE